jgi:hypothetical protein
MVWIFLPRRARETLKTQEQVQDALLPDALGQSFQQREVVDGLAA